MTTQIAAAGALERPEQVRLAVRVRGDDRAIGEDDLVLDDVVGGEAGAADQPADAATGDAAADADRAGSCSTNPTEAATTPHSRSRSRSGRQLAQDILELSVVDAMVLAKVRIDGVSFAAGAPSARGQVYESIRHLRPPASRR